MNNLKPSKSILKFFVEEYVEVDEREKQKDQIEFIQALTMEGSMQKDKKPEPSETERKKMDIEET